MRTITMTGMAVLAAVAGCVSSKDDGMIRPGKLTLQYELPIVCNGIAVGAGDRRHFVSFPKPDGGGGATLCEVDHGFICGVVPPTHEQLARLTNAKPYPDIDWNSWQPGDGAKQKFVRVNALRFGPDGNLWVIDIGSPGPQQPTVPGGPKLVAIDTKKNKVVRTIFLDDVAKADKPGGKGNSFFDDFRFGDANIYVTDAGAPGLVVVDRQSGRARRVLDNHPSTIARTMYAERRKLIKPNGEPVAIHADQLEVSPDGKWLYYSPCSGPMSRIETKYLDDASLTEAELAGHVQPFFDCPTIGGTAIDDRGRLYLSDVDKQRILRVSPDGKTVETVVADEANLHWPHALYIDDDKNLWIPAAQINRTPGMNFTTTEIEWPIRIFATKINAGPVRR